MMCRLPENILNEFWKYHKSNGHFLEKKVSCLYTSIIDDWGKVFKNIISSRIAFTDFIERSVDYESTWSLKWDISSIFTFYIQQNSTKKADSLIFYP